MKRFFFFLIYLLCASLFAQNQLSSDELFVKARDAAFNQKNRKLAREICKTILIKSPNYSDVSVFLGRLYTWDSMYDSARAVLTNVLLKDSTNEDAINAAIDLEYWSGNSPKALEYCNRGLTYNPTSSDFLLKKARVLDDMERYDEAFVVLEKLISLKSDNTDALAFAERLKEKVRKNAIGVTYEYDKFDKTFDPWQLGSISYSRRTPIGTTILRINLARRFGTSGVQYEIDMYPRFGDGIYSYLNIGFSKVGVFPKNRYGASLYISLPLSFEIDGGFRLLRYSSDTWIYTFALGKYYGNYWFSLRTFITPQIEKASYSYSLIVRYYFSTAYDYLALSIGTGITPNETSIDFQGNWLKSNKLGLEYQSQVSRVLILNFSGDYYGDEYLRDSFRTKLSLGMGIKFLF